MKKEIILLAASMKANNYCIAGIDRNNGEWIRIISEDIQIQNSIKKEDMCYEDNSFPQLLDIIQIQCKRPQPNKYQPENYVFDNKYNWVKLGQANLDEVLRIHPLELKEYIFYDNNKFLPQHIFEHLNPAQKHSLILISPSNITVHVKEWAERRNVTISFRYNGNWYNYLPVTDIDFRNKYLKMANGDYKLNKHTILVLSIGDKHKKDNRHYKLVVTVINR